MLLSVLALLGGFLLAGVGGDLFVRGCLGTANALRIPNAIVAVTIAAFATSSPELSVAINAALEGTPQIAIGDAFGSNIVNVALVLGTSLCFGSMPCNRKDIARDWLLAFLAPLMVLLMTRDGVVDRLDVIVLLLSFCAWLIVLVIAAGKHRRSILPDIGHSQKMGRALIYLATGLALLIGSGTLIVIGAKGVGAGLGLSPFITGVTLVALGTSMPELATSLIARYHGHHDIGLGTVLGSNIFNLMLIVATAAMIHPIAITSSELLKPALIGLAMLVVVFPNKGGSIPRWRAVPLLVGYVLYIGTVVA
ncbi:MAG: sodium:calcium antiporter [Alphaproteobacteria bacterium]|nr:sodium:calcium antiporter [Alphaproteobacteria bacterium]